MITPIALLVIAAAPAWKVPGSYDRDAAPNWGHDVAVAGTTSFISTSTAAVTAGDESTIRLHTWGTRLRITCLLPVCACVTMDDDVTLNIASNTCGGVIDPGTPPNTVGKCVRIYGDADAELGEITVVIDRALFPTDVVSASSPPGHRSSGCSAPAGMLGYPCDNDNDCGGAGTCSSSQAPLGAFVALIGDNATTCSVTELL